MIATPLLDSLFDLAEGPLWDAARQRLYWVDIMSRRIHWIEPATGSSNSLDALSPVGTVALAEDGRLLAALQYGFALIDPDTNLITPLATFPEASPKLRMNDGKPDPAGRFWAGTMAFDFAPNAGALYRLSPSLELHTALTGVTISNGLDWSPDFSLMYYVDSTTQRVDVFDFDPVSSNIRARRTFVEIDPVVGTPDGLTVDSTGNLWLALWGGSAVHAYSPQGKLEAVVEVPSPQVSCCAFGGSDMRDLYITSAYGGLSPESRSLSPHAGAVFVCRPGPTGRAPFLFKA